MHTKAISMWVYSLKQEYRSFCSYTFPSGSLLQEEEVKCNILLSVVMTNFLKWGFSKNFRASNYPVINPETAGTKEQTG